MMDRQPIKRIVHLIPYDAIGGVEIAARSLQCGHYGALKFERQYLIHAPGIAIEHGEYHGPQISVNNPIAYWRAIWRLYRNPPDLLVASLWRSALVMIFFKLLRPKTRLVIFLHVAKDVHFVDKAINWLGMVISNTIWADSFATLQQRLPKHLQAKGRSVSFLLEHHPLPEQRDPAPEFIFWGRLSAQKGLERALDLFSAIVRQRRDARLTIIGPDGGIEGQLQERVVKLGLLDHVIFKGPMRHVDISEQASRASFYLQLSLDEGMAISVVEAMQSGLVPVVTPVGEIGQYCTNGINAVLVYDDATAVQDVMALLSDPVKYKKISKCAAEYWQGRPLYCEDFINAAKEAVG